MDELVEVPRGRTNGWAYIPETNSIAIFGDHRSTGSRYVVAEFEVAHKGYYH